MNKRKRKINGKIFCDRDNLKQSDDSKIVKITINDGYISIRRTKNGKFSCRINNKRPKIMSGYKMTKWVWSLTHARKQEVFPKFKKDTSLQFCLDKETQITISSNLMEKFVEYAKKDEKKECGAVLIGDIVESDKKIIANVTDIFIDDKLWGDAASFDFTAEFKIRAAMYAISKDKRVVGNIHSHAQFNVFFSCVDTTMMRLAPRINCCYLVYSPRFNTFTACVVNKDYKYFLPKVVFEPTNDMEEKACCGV